MYQRKNLYQNDRDLPTDRATSKTMFSRLFRAHGQFCASRPWEVIIGTLMLTVCVMSMSLFSGNRKVCGWNIRCAEKEDDTKSSDVIILTLTRCLAVIYLYLQFRKLRRLGSKYLLGVACVLTIVASFVFSIGIANILGSDLTGLNEALPFFLLLVDLSKACTMARFALSSSSQDEVVDNIGSGMAVVGPQLTLDTVVETLVIGVGMLSGIKTLETVCCFGCLSVIANYFAFIVFYPACLALVLELTRGSRPLLHVQQLASLWEEEEEKPNPVTQRVKVIMCAGLVFVYAQSRLTADANLVGSKVSGLPPDLSQVVAPDIPIWRFYVAQCSSMSVDYVLMLILTAFLALKYVIFDGDESRLTNSRQDSTARLTFGKQCTAPQEAMWQQSSFHSSTACNGFVKLEDTQDASVTSSKNEIDEENTGIDDTDLQRETTKAKAQSRFEVGLKVFGNSRFILGDSSDEEEKEERVMIAVGTQTDSNSIYADAASELPRIPRSIECCRAILKSEVGAGCLTDEEILMLIKSKDIPAYKLEAVLNDYERGVAIRRRMISQYFQDTKAIDNLPFTNYNYKYVDGACCENVIGYLPVPVGYAGPLLLNGKQYVIPMATTEGCLVASTNRGCRALSSGAGVRCMVTRDGMTRAPLVRFASAKRACDVKVWLEDTANYDRIAETFNSTSRFARLKSLSIVQVSRSLYIRFVAVTGDAMGMNMLSKGTEKVLNMLQEKFFPDMEIVSLSGNFCTDKKPSAINWIEGRGKSIVAEAVVSRDVIKNILKTSVSALVDLNINKNLVGSAVAGSIGGFNAHAANIVTAIYIATGQDPAQNVSSSNCITIMEPSGPYSEDLYISCTMPSIEVGTIGGGTILPPQAGCLEMLGVRGADDKSPGSGACRLATVVCAAVLAGELSLMSALAAGHLVKSHLKHNRSVLNMTPRADKTFSNRTEEIGTCISTAP